jgi:hypothetical protein
MKNIPKTIYLQIGDKVQTGDFRELSIDDITWSTEKINHNDICYKIRMHENGVFITNKEAQLFIKLMKEKVESQNKEEGNGTKQ